MSYKLTGKMYVSVLLSFHLLPTACNIQHLGSMSGFSEASEKGLSHRLHSHPMNPTPSSEKADSVHDIRASNQLTPSNEKTVDFTAETQHMAQGSDNTNIPICLPVPSDFNANYGSFATAFLDRTFIENHWDDEPIVLNQSNCRAAPETPFLEVVGQISVDQTFTQGIRQGSVIEISEQDHQHFKYFATYSQLMDRTHAYVRIVAYNREGSRCHAGHTLFGNRILIIPRHLNNVRFPPQLRFYAFLATDGYPDEEHNRIRAEAWASMTPLEKVWWIGGRLAICDGNLQQTMRQVTVPRD
jgi:hypothetical protein